MFRSALIAAVLSLVPGLAAAEIVSRSTTAFTLRFSADVAVSPDRMIQAVGEVPLWWDAGHTFTGDAGNLSLAFQPGGCWCERMTNGTDFRHGELVEMAADRVRFDAPLGPLNGQTDRADLSFTATPTDGGSVASMEYVVEGDTVGRYADAVHGVMQAAWNRYLRHAQHVAFPVAQ